LYVTIIEKPALPNPVRIMPPDEGTCKSFSHRRSGILPLYSGLSPLGEVEISGRMPLLRFVPVKLNVKGGTNSSNYGIHGIHGKIFSVYSVVM
jgi:hypothetical protein